MNRYTVFHAFALRELESKVQLMQLNGWVCQGGIAAVFTMEGIRFFQAMVMEEK